MSEPVHVDQVVLEFSLDGGIESVAFEMQRAFRAAGIDSRVITSVTRETAEDVERIVPLLAGIGSRGRLRHLGRALTVPAFTVAATWRLRASRRQRPRRVILSHGDTLAGDVCVVHAVNRANLDMKRAAGAWRWRLNPMHHWVSLRDRLMIGGLRFRRYVALSERVVSELQSYYGVPRDRIVLIPNGVNLDRFCPGPADRDDVRRELGVSASTPMLLFVGHEFDRKGLVHAIDALAQTRGGNGHAGGGRLRAAGCLPRPRGTPRGAPPGHVPGRPLGPAAALSSRGRLRVPDGLRVFLVDLHGSPAGLPVFATAVGGIEDYLKDGMNGRIIRPDGPDIAAALAPMLADPALQDTYRAGALATAREYGWPAIAARYHRLLMQVADEIAGATASPVARRNPIEAAGPAGPNGPDKDNVMQLTLDHDGSQRAEGFGLLRRLARQKTLFLAGFLLTATCVAAAFTSQQETYRATAALMVASNEAVLRSGSSSAEAQRLGDPADIESQMLMLRSPRLARAILGDPKVVDALIADCLATQRGTG